MDHIIIIERRAARGKQERKEAGHCHTEDNMVSRIFINKNQRNLDIADTFFHEVAHAYMHWRGYKDGAKRERRAFAIGVAAAKALHKTK